MSVFVSHGVMNNAMDTTQCHSLGVCLNHHHANTTCIILSLALAYCYAASSLG